MQFGLMFFASSANAEVADKYHLVIASAKFADAQGFASLWVPERHFTQMGALYPNPAVLHAALARETRRIRLQAGSVVVPLHHPIRIAEEWAVVDNLSGGRIGLSFASGWHPNDFAFFPEKYHHRRQDMYAGIEMVRKLWQGEAMQVTSGTGQSVHVKVYPRPVQKELPIWITAAGSPQTFAKAGEMGLNLLTHMLDQPIEQLAKKIDVYRQARARHGHDPDAGQVSLMLHTFVGRDVQAVREAARAPFCAFLKGSPDMLAGLAQSRDRSVDTSMLSPRELDDFVNFLYDRFASSRGLIGTPDTCLELLGQLERIGVTEVACLLDFGPQADVILEHLPYLSELQARYQDAAVQPAWRRQPYAPAQQVAAPEAFPSTTSGWGQETLHEICRRCDQETPVAEFYDQLCAYGLQIEVQTQGLERLWRAPGEALGQVRLAEPAPSMHASAIPAALFETCVQVLMATLPLDTFSSASGTYLPFGLRSLQVYQRPGPHAWSHAVRRPETSVAADTFEGDVRLFDADGHVSVEIMGLRLQRALGAASAPVWWDWLYALQWEPKPLGELQPFEQPGSWLIFTDSSGIGQHLAALLEAHGESCVLVHPGKAYAVDTEGRYWLNPGCPQEMQQVVHESLGQRMPPCRGVVHLWSLDASPAAATSIASLATDQERGVASALHMIQALSTSAAQPRVWFITRGAQPCGNAIASVAQSPLWGLGRTVAVEYPHLWGGLVDVAPQVPADEVALQLFHTLQSADREDQIAWRQGERHVARLQRHQGVEHAPWRFRSDATYLLTGGLGGLGGLLAHWMVAHGARHLALVGRSAAAETSRDTISRLQEAGAQVLVLQADVAQEAEVARVLAQIEQTMPQLRGIFHLAGLLDDGLLVQQTWERFTKVRAAKAEGAWNLHALTQHLLLECFVLFSSFAVLMHLPGQGSYAAANSFLDALAHYRRAQGLPALSVNWGPWAEAGHASTSYGRRAHAYLGRLGIEQMGTAPGFDALGMLLQQDQTQAAVASINWARLLQEEFAAHTPLLATLAGEVQSAPGVPGQQEDMLQKLHAAPEAESYELVTMYLQGQATQILRLNGAQTDVQQPLNDMGFDSLMAVELKNKIRTDLGVDIALVSFLEGPSVATLATQVVSQLAEHPASPRAGLAAATSEMEWVEGEL